MPNNFDSNTTRKLARVFLEKFESERVLSKNVNTQLLSGEFDPSTGDTVDFKRPTDYVSIRSPGGDVSGDTPSPIITGKASGVVQDFFTVLLDWNIVDRALKMDQLDELLAPAATRIKTDLEVDFAGFMMRNAALNYGTVGTPPTTWDHIAGAGATMESTGIPKDGMWNYTVNPFTQIGLANQQRSLGTDGTVDSANRMATIAENFAGMRVMTATTLDTYSTSAVADRVGALSANPDVTYLTAKDSMQQTLPVSGFGANLVISAGETIQITGRNKLNLNTRRNIIDAAGSQVVFTATVAQDVTLSGAGAGNIIISGPALFEAGGAYNTVDSAPISGDVVTVLGAASSLYQPNLFWHKNAFGIGSVPIPKLYSTDTIATTEDGLQFRVSKGAQFRENKNEYRIDFLPAYSTLNPFFAGQGWG